MNVVNNTSNKPIIAIDVDDVLAQFVPAFCVYARKKWNEEITLEIFTEDWSKIMKKNDLATIKARAAEMFADTDFYNNLLPVVGAKKTLQKLADKFVLVPMTSRISPQRDVTTNWLLKYFGDIFEETIFSGAYEADSDFSKTVHLSKGEICYEVGASYLIDDQPKHANGGAAVGINAILFGDYHWNRDIEIIDGVTRATNWGGVADYFGV
jgi:5'(3')-deoxyribonucleotidase